MTFRDVYTEIFKRNCLEEFIKDEIIEKFEILTEIMVKQNEVMNITALTTIDKIVPLHYADCAKVEKWIPYGSRVIDIGCGGGFPILPLAIIRPDLQITGLDSTEKKIRYVQNTASQLGLKIETVSARAEDAVKNLNFRETYDVAISRAVARMNILSELCIPFVKTNGFFIAMKGAAGSEEAEEAKQGIKKMGGIIEKIDEYELFTGNENEKRTVIKVEKVRSTPKTYPRSFGSIKKKPL